MDGKGRATDNIFIGRLWHTVKYENVRFNGYSDRTKMAQGLQEYFVEYNCIRRHSSIGNDAKINSDFDLFFSPFSSL